MECHAAHIELRRHIHSRDAHHTPRTPYQKYDIAMVAWMGKQFMESVQFGYAWFGRPRIHERPN